MNKNPSTTYHLTTSHRGGAGHKGFTLIETLFSILIFSAALISLMTIAAKGISATENSEQTTTASYLAQEGIEVARNIRDTNYATGGTAWTNLSQCTITAPCDLAYGSSSAPSVPTLVNCSIVSGTASPSCSVPIKQNSQTGWYSDSGTIPTQFYRTIYLVEDNPASSSLNQSNTGSGPNEYQVISRVNWTYRTIPHVVSLDTILRDWQ
jgi:Tfp pilus assembly protein PilV